MCVEVRQLDGTWISDGIQVDLGRNYDMFGIVAGVRNPLIVDQINGVDRAWLRMKGFTLGEPKGFPNDLSQEVFQEWNRTGDHTPSWCTLDEAQFWVDEYKRICKKYEEEPYYTDWQNVIDEARKLEYNENEVRLVFWFDS